VLDGAQDNPVSGDDAIHFATHGVLTGQLEGSAEPGLILTPPPKALRDRRSRDIHHVAHRFRSAIAQRD
jgi:hypothetical protein